MAGKSSFSHLKETDILGFGSIKNCIKASLSHVILLMDSVPKMNFLFLALSCGAFRNDSNENSGWINCGACFTATPINTLYFSFPLKATSQAYWLRSSVVSVLFSLTTGIESLTRSCSIVFLNSGYFSSLLESNSLISLSLHYRQVEVETPF